MLKKLSENHQKMSFEKKEELINNFFSMFYGGEEKLLSHLHKLKEQSETDEEILEILKLETNINFWLKASEILQFNNITELIASLYKLQENSDELLSLITNHDGLKRMLEIQKPLAESGLKILFNINFDGKNKEESKILAKNIFYVTKESIAKEFDCDKKTLKKWLKIKFEDKFNRKDRKITIDEYIEIFEAFFLSNDENLDLNNDINKYLKRLENGINFSKRDLAKLCDSDLKTQKENLKEVAFFSHINKFPYSFCKILSDKMGYELEF